MFGFVALEANHAAHLEAHDAVIFVLATQKPGRQPAQVRQRIRYRQPKGRLP